MKGLAGDLDAMGRREEAETMHREVIEARSRTLCQEHPDTLQSMSDLAWVLLRQGKALESEEMHFRILAIRARTLGPEHPDTLRSMDHIAGVGSEEVPCCFDDAAESDGATSVIAIC